ncbi:MAG: metal-binding protein [Thalassobium sp.]|nr:metal-binding protein [Alcanivorax sp.]PHQ80553.1 MAG: metal-binding protein [Thalassobium sp.]
MCGFPSQPTLTDISNAHSEFISGLIERDIGDWVKLMECPVCGQLYKVDEWDKYQTCYAVKVPSPEGWREFDGERLIKERMMENRGGLASKVCMRSGCEEKQVNGSAYCVNHLYAGGTHA